MMRVLLLGGQGMAGHMIRDYFQKDTPHDVWSTIRSTHLQNDRAVLLDARNRRDVLQVLEQIRPDVVINAIGILNQAADNCVSDAIYVNSLLPHWLAEFGERLGYRLMHISTDCVFSGKKGRYKETDNKDGSSLYAQTKSVGEVASEHHLTIRTSIIGPELKHNGIGLFQWFMKQSGVVYGYQNVLWNGVTTLQLAKTLATLLPTSTSGVAHLTAPEPISKLNLLRLVQKVFERNDIIIQPDSRIISDKTLVNTRKDFDIPVPGYEEMLRELKAWMGM